LGTAHERPIGSGACGGFSKENVLAGGDTFFSATPSVMVDRGGTIYNFGPVSFNGSGGIGAQQYAPSLIEDRNGNKLTIAGTASSFTITDTVGRSVLSTNGFGVSGNTVTVPSLPSPYGLSWGTANSNFTVGMANPAQTPNCPVAFNPDSETQSVIRSIRLPNGQSYTFTYDSDDASIAHPYGLITKITYPTGGWVKYTWKLNLLATHGIFNDGSVLQIMPLCELTYDTPAVATRTVSFDGQNPAMVQTFNYSTVYPSNSDLWSSKQSTVTSQDVIRGRSFETDYTYVPVLILSSPNDPFPCFCNQVAVENTVTDKDWNGSILKTVTKAWQNQYLLTDETTRLGTGATAPTSSVHYVYYPAAQGFALQEKDEYNFGAGVKGTLARKTVIAYASFPSTPIYPTAPSIFDKPATVIAYDGNGIKFSETDYAYDQSAVGAVSNLPAGTHDETNYPSTSTAPRGNATTVTRKCLQSCVDAITKFTYDETGQTLTKIEPCGNTACSDMTGSNHTTLYFYADNFDSPPSGNTNAYLTKITDALGHFAAFKYAYADGQLISATDPNGLITSYLYNDPLRRPTETDRPDGGSTTISYNDSPPSPSIITTKKINSTQTVASTTVMDGMGHVKQMQLTSDPQGTVYADTTFDGLGRVWKQSNPYRIGTDPTTSSGTTIYTYDALGRKTLEAEPGTDGSAVTTAYCGPSTLVTDPTGKWRRSRTDALGHLVEVDEPNAVGVTVSACPGTGEQIWVTNYGNDILGDLTSVLQNGSHSRSFAYDSLSRLLTSSNPEVGTITYTYDADSNVSTKKDARNITTTYGYDVLSRLKNKSYSNGEPMISINYDESNCLGLSSCQNVGQRTSSTDASGSEAWSFQVDKAHLHSVHVNQRTTASTPSNITKSSTYYMDLAGNLSSIVYPSGRTVNYTFDNAGRPSTAIDGSTGITYATAPPTPLSGCLASKVCYTPQGSIYSMSLGQTTGFTGLNINETFNSRLQPNEIKVSSTGGNAMDLSYNFIDPATLKNAGHVYGTVNNMDTTRSQSFTYDQLNRITGAQTNVGYASSPSHCWSEVFGLDAWANLQSIAATTNSAYTGCSQESGFAQTANAFNHLPSFGYDASGNTTGDGIHNYQWNAESQFTWTYNVSYHYDGDGRRVSKVGGNAPKLYWYGSGGEILSETSPAGYLINDYIFFGGKRIAAAPNDLNLNGGFEQGLTNWSVSGSGTATPITNAANAHSGSSYVDISTSAGGAATKLTTTQPISAQQGETVTAAGWVYREVGGQQYSRLWLNVQGSNGSVGGHPVDNTTMNTWIYQTSSAVIPSWLVGPYTATIYAEVDSTSTTLATSARFDDVTLNGNLTLFTEDMLGTSRVVTDGSGIVCYDGDFYPYGSERAYTNTCDPVYKFEGKERDTETGNDDFGARYYSNRFGRWLSADWSNVPAAVPYTNLINPQTLNLYSMVADDPESFADLDGHKINCADHPQQCQQDARDSTANAEAAARVTTETKTHGWWIFKWTETTIKIAGDIASFRALSPNASKLADLVGSSKTITVSYNLDQGKFAQPSFFGQPQNLNGGSTSFTNNQGYAFQAFIDPRNTSWNGKPFDQDAADQHLPQANTAEEFGHEVLGHIWGELFGGHPAGGSAAGDANRRDSIIGENAVRAMNPTRGQKNPDVHH